MWFSLLLCVSWVLFSFLLQIPTPNTFSHPSSGTSSIRLHNEPYTELNGRWFCPHFPLTSKSFHTADHTFLLQILFSLDCVPLPSLPPPHKLLHQHIKWRISSKTGSMPTFFLTLCTRVQQTCPIKNQIVNIVGFSDHRFFVATAQFYQCITNTTIWHSVKGKLCS